MPDGMVMKDKSRTAGLLLVGVITAPHGVRGLVRVKSFTQDPADLVAYGALTDKSGTASYDLDIRGESKGQFLVAFDDIADRDAAEAARGRELYIRRDQLPEAEEDAFYHADLIGLSARLADGDEIGTVTAVHDFGAGDILDVRLTDGRSVLYPFTRDVVPTVDIAGGFVTIVPPVEVEARAVVEDGEAGEERS